MSTISPALKPRPLTHVARCQVGKLSLRDIDVNEPFTSRDVRIDIKSVGICGSDVHYYQHGVIGPFVVNQPMILGHEASGIVTEIGTMQGGHAVDQL